MGAATAEANLAPAFLFPFMVKVAGLLLPLRSPVQPPKTLGANGVAVNVTVSPGL
jgi:hypothetical protein